MGNLTNSQKSIWVTEQYYKGSSVNNICGSAIIEEQIDFEKLKKAVEIVNKKHDNFRLQIKIEDGEVKQVLSEKKDTKIDIISVATPKELEKETQKIVRTPFKLEDSELYRFYIFKFENGQGGFMLNIHHLIADAWTLAFISNDIIKTYSELKQEKPVETEAIYSYIDYIQAEQEYLESEKYQKDKAYWEEKFAQIPEVATIPGSKTNGDESNPAGERKQFNLDASKVEKIKEYCKENKISLYNFFMAIYAIYIGEISNLDEFVIGTPILNRTNFKEKNAAGMFINMAPFKINMDQTSNFKAFVKNIAIDSMGMLKHQKYSYQSLLEDLRTKNKTIPSLYNVLLSYQITNAHQTGEDMTYTTQWTFNGCCAENMDIQIYDLNDTGCLNIAYDYKTSIYDVEDIEKLHKRILNIISQVISKENIDLKDIQIVTPEEKQQLVIDFNKTELEYDENIPIIKYFEEQVLKTPDNVAIVFENKEMTYKELNEKANSLAYELRKNGVTNNTIVGIMQDRSFEMMIAILAVLKAGGSYIPIAPDYPNERIEYMLEDSKATILLTTNQDRIKIDKKIIDINLNEEFYKANKENLENISKPEDLSYLIYTSGSTGTPKGVMLKQKNLSNFYNAMKDTIKYLKDGKLHKIISITTVSFDIFIFETLMSLTKGLTLYMTNENQQKITSQLEKVIKENEIEILQTTPSVMKFHLDNLENKEDIKSLKYIMLAGEPLPKTLVDKLKETIPGVTVYNGYGPSETTIFSTTRDVTDLDIVTIGRPVANTQIYILNKNKKLMPQGTIGELYIAGDGVGKGYMNKKEQTESSFIQNPFVANSIMYKVGDLGAFDVHGEITCYGRVDNQVKIRGLRVELPEIEKQMLSANNVQNTVVVKKEINGREVLCAYYVPNGPVNENAMKSILKDKLPQYMIPQYFVRLKEMPYTPNGKIDKRALPMPNIEEKTKEKIEIRNEIDKELLQIIQKMMSNKNIDLSDTLIDIGGDSLTAITLLTKISSKFDVQLYIKDIMSNKTIKEISDLITQNKEKGTSKIKIEKAPKQDVYPLSSAQKRMYYNSKMIGEDNIVYNISGGILVDDILDKEKVRNAFEKIIERHSVLRTVFVLQENNVMQKVNEKIDFNIQVYNNTESEIQKIINNFSKPFDLEKDLLLRVELHYIDNNKTLLLIESHHAAMDGTSLNNLIIEFERLYNGENLKTIPIQYTDYAVWENKFNESEAIKNVENYWVNKFKEAEFAQLNLPYDYKATANRSYKGNRISNIIDENQFRQIEKYAEKIGVSPYMLFISAFFILLYKYTGQEEIMVGSPIANRDINETKRMIGMFVNNIVVKGNINSEETFQEFLNNIKEQILDDLSNQPYPFDMLIKKLGIKSDNSRNPIFDVMFTYQNQEENLINLDNHEAEIIEINNNIAKFNLSLEIKPKTHTINIEYCTELFKKQTIEIMFEHYMNVLDAIIVDNNVKIMDISVISEQEKNKILYEFNDTKMEYFMNKSVAQLFEEQVEKTPDNIAVIFEEKKLTYRELNEKANQLANYLRNIKIKSNDTIGVMLPRSLEIAIAFLGISKAGATYIPIDPVYPEKRVEYMLENSQARLLITTQDLYEKLNVVNKISIENKEIVKQCKNNIDTANSPDDLAYIIYTSGSTGLPKGVKITNKNLVNFIFGTKQVIDLNEKKIMVSVTTICFDIFGLELWCSLTSGMTVVIANEEEQHNTMELNKLCIKNNVNVIQTTPSRYAIMLEDKENIEFLKNMTDILVGGEPISEQILKEMKENSNARIFNMYGPTETTIWSTIKELTNAKNITIGKPISNTQVYVLDKYMKVLPIGVAGELYISGDGVGKGYLNREDITKERYVKNPFVENGIMYNTGDICKFADNGELYCLGRLDNQIKIRGLRIELEEIENKILEFPFINNVKVIKQTIGNREIISAYYISNRRIRIAELRKFLQEALPNYMVPSYFTALDKFPYTPNGKIDKNALPVPSGILQNEKVGYVAPKTDLEVKLASIWEEVLNTKPIGVKDNFFELGGDSILAMNLNIKLLSVTDKIKYSDIFSYPTIAELAEKINSDLQQQNQEKLDILNDKYESILKNNMNLPQLRQANEFNNILLTGVTGYLGIHIMQEFLEKEKGKIFVIVRKDPGATVEEKLLNKMHYYFGDVYDKYIGDRINIVEGDIAKDGFGLNQEDLFKLGNSVDLIVNSAAKVSHYGSYLDFYNTNVKSVEKIINFANTFKQKIFHISTLSVSGNAFVDQYYIEQDIEEKIEFCENNLFVGQKLENVYIRSKFEAEKRILDAILNGTDAYIFRIGNLMPRIFDGKFQENINENAYISRLKTFIRIGYMPDYLVDGYLEFTPIDSISQAILKIMKFTNKENRIYHLFNHNHVFIKDLLELIKNDIQIITSEEFKKNIRKILKNSNSDLLNTLINDLDKDLNLNYDSKITLNSKHTIELLKLYGFKWPKIDEKYIRNILKLIKGE
ncbi:MAG: amino acid adenylation domain-containing protein [Clostridia bacterium]|nr:amino acid adenylation domain-containing protein [Clostridia bacterium]